MLVQTNFCIFNDGFASILALYDWELHLSDNELTFIIVADANYFDECDGNRNIRHGEKVQYCIEITVDFEHLDCLWHVDEEKDHEAGQ